MFIFRWPAMVLSNYLFLITRHAFAPLRQWRMLGNLDHYREKQVFKDPAFS
jgi:hypothetical protein